MKKTNATLISMSLAIAMLSACSTTSPATPEEIAADKILENHIVYDAVIPTGTETSLFPTPYQDTFRVGDTVALDILNVEDASGNFVVNSNGNVDFPLIGERTVLGKSIEQVQRDLKQAYAADFIVNPTILVEREALPLGEIVIDGWVASPGIHELTRNITLQKAIAMVGGLKEEGDAKRIVVSRMRGDKRVGLEYNLKGIREQGLADPLIIPGDIIYVTSDDAKIFFREVIQTSPLIALFLNSANF